MSKRPPCAHGRGGQFALCAEAEIAVGVVERDVLDDAAEPLEIVRNLALLDFLAELLAEETAEVLVPRVAEETARVREHSDEVAERAERRERLDLLAHPVLLVEEPPRRAKLDLPAVRRLLEAAHDRREHLGVLRVEGVEDAARERVLALEAVEELREVLGDGPVADRVEAGVRTHHVVHRAVEVPDAVVVELRRPVGLRVRLQPLVEPRALELERLGGRERLSRDARLLEDRLELGLGIGRGEDLRETVVGDDAARLLEELMALRHRLAEVVHRPNGHSRGLRELVDPLVPRLQVLDLRRLVAAPRRTDLRPERLLRDREMVFKRVDGIVRRADDLDVRLLHEPARRKPLGLQLPVARRVDALRARSAQTLGHAEVARELEVRPVEERILHEALHRLRKRLEPLPARRAAVRAAAGAEPLLESAGAHLPPLVVVAAKPDVRDVVPALVLRDLRRRKMAVVVDDRHLLRMAVVELLRRLGREEEVVVDERLFRGHCRCPFAVTWRNYTIFCRKWLF